jgi:twitching motility protein PilT
VFPKNEEKVIRTRIAQSFRFKIYQRLIPLGDGKGRIAAIEILKATMRTREYVEKGESEGKSLIDAMEQGDQDGMQTFDSVIERFIRDGVVSIQAALPYATNQNNLLLKISDLAGAPPPMESEKPARDETSMLDLIEP